MRLLTKALVLVFGLVAMCGAQQAAPLSKAEQAVKRKAGSLSAHDRISVIRIHAAEEYGDFVSSDEGGFTFYDVDEKRNVTLRYAEVRKIKDGYGGYNSLRHRHTDRRRALIVGAAVLGGLLVLAIVAGAS